MYQVIDGFSFVRMDSRDVPKAVDYGALFGITGLDWFEDYKLSGKGIFLEVVEELPFGESEIWSIREPSNLADLPMTVITPYENIARRYLEDKGIPYRNLAGQRGEVEVVRGKTEGWLKGMIADLVIDNVDSGRTVKENNLELCDKIMDSYGVVIADGIIKGTIKRILDGEIQEMSRRMTSIEI